MRLEEPLFLRPHPPISDALWTSGTASTYVETTGTLPPLMVRPRPHGAPVGAKAPPLIDSPLQASPPVACKIFCLKDSFSCPFPHPTVCGPDVPCRAPQGPSSRGGEQQRRCLAGSDGRKEVSYQQAITQGQLPTPVGDVSMRLKPIFLDDKPAGFSLLGCLSSTGY